MSWVPAPRTVEVASARDLEVTPDAIARHPEWAWLGPPQRNGSKPLRGDVSVRAKIQNAEELAETPLRFVAGHRADLVRFTRGAILRGLGDFEPSWVKWVKTHVWWEAIERWYQAGYNLEPLRRMDTHPAMMIHPVAIRRVMSGRPSWGHAPVFYFVGIGNRYLAANSFVADLSSRGYREWCIQQIKEALREFFPEASALFMGPKRVMYSSPAARESRPDGTMLRWADGHEEWQPGGPRAEPQTLHHAGFEPGEWDEAFDAYISEAADAGVPPYIVQAVQPHWDSAECSGEWSGFSQATQDRFLGAFRGYANRRPGVVL